MKDPAASSDRGEFLPSDEPIRLVADDGAPVFHDDYKPPDDDLLRLLHRRMVVGRRFDQQATSLTKQGRLAVYPSSHGQEACQIGAVTALADQDWLFPTYRDSVALVTRDIDPVQALTLLRGDWHCGYDPYSHRTGPQCTPLATSAPHAVGLAQAARLKGEDVAVLVFVGDGGTSEGDAHEAFNFAAVWGAPVVFFIQNNQYAISVPLAKQTNAPTLAHKAIGYGMPGHLVDGNDVAAVYAVTSRALAAARSGGGPAVIEGLTYRVDAHTNADDATRYQPPEEIEAWRQQDPVVRLDKLLSARGLLDEKQRAAIDAEAEALADTMRERLHEEPRVDPMDLFAHVYAEPTPQLREQAHRLAEELVPADGTA
jgi:2-oxoisovalerate dehydrogenase E1 component alpha subunit